MNVNQIVKRLSTTDGLLISLYLPIATGETRKEFVTTFRSHLKDLRHTAKNLKHQQEKYLNLIIKQIENYLETVDTHNTKSLAIFAGKNLFETYKLPVSVPLKAKIDTKLLLSPLSNAFDENPAFIIVVIDRTIAKIIEVNLGLEETESKVIKSDVPQRILAKGADTGRESKILRHIEEHLHRHLEKVAAEVKKFESTHPKVLLIIAAQKELVEKFKKLLTENLKVKLIGDFGANVSDNETQVIRKAQKIVDLHLEKEAWHEI